MIVKIRHVIILGRVNLLITAS